MGRRKLTQEEQEKYNKLVENAEQISMRISDLLNRPVVYGYARVSSKGQAKDGNSLEAQRQALEAAGAEFIYTDVYTGTTTERPELSSLISDLKEGDTIIVTKLDRIARSVQQGSELIESLVEKGVTVNVLNMGVMDNTPTGKFIRNIMLSFAEFERDMIMQRTREGREIARQNPNHREGRKPKYPKEQMDLAMQLLEGPHSYNDVVKATGISKSTLIREKKRRM